MASNDALLAVAERGTREDAARSIAAWMAAR